MTSFVLVHGAWHTGEVLEQSAAKIRAKGHDVYLPTLAGNRLGESKDVSLEQAIEGLLGFLKEQQLTDVVLFGHSYAGMVVTGVADRAPERIRRLVYQNAFIPNDGECLNDMIPHIYVELFDQLTQADGTVTMPFELWREAFINDASLELAQSAYDTLNPHPIATFKDRIKLSKNPADMQIGKSYINATEDIALPHSYPWHPRLSEKLGLFRLEQCAGSHEICFTNPGLLAEKIMLAGRD